MDHDRKADAYRTDRLILALILGAAVFVEAIRLIASALA